MEFKKITRVDFTKNILALSERKRIFHAERCFSQKFRESNMPHDVFTKFLSNDDERIFHNFKTK